MKGWCGRFGSCAERIRSKGKACQPVRGDAASGKANMPYRPKWLKVAVINSKEIMKNVARDKPTLLVPALYLLCGLLVVIYVNLFTLFRLVNEYLGSGFILATPLLLPFILLFLVIRRRARKGLRHNWLLIGLFLVFIGLILPDPAFPVKRIHVAEYLFLSLIVRYALARNLVGRQLIFFSVLVSAVYGIHDELLQGFHPSRTYGLRDMLVNIVAAAGGCFIWHSLDLFVGTRTCSTGEVSWSPLQIGALVWLVFAVAALVVPLTVYRHGALPWWPFLPLAAAVVVWACVIADDSSPLRHGLVPLGWTAFPMLCYPFAAHVFQISFR